MHGSLLSVLRALFAFVRLTYDPPNAKSLPRLPVTSVATPLSFSEHRLSSDQSHARFQIIGGVSGETTGFPGSYAAKDGSKTGLLHNDNLACAYILYAELMLPPVSGSSYAAVLRLLILALQLFEVYRQGKFVNHLEGLLTVSYAATCRLLLFARPAVVGSVLWVVCCRIRLTV